MLMEPDTSNKLSYPKYLKQDEIPVLTIEALKFFCSMQLSITRQENNPQGDACMVYGNDNTFITNAQPFKSSLLATKESSHKEEHLANAATKIGKERISLNNKWEIIRLFVRGDDNLPY